MPRNGIDELPKLLRNLEDAGCDETLIREFMRCNEECAGMQDGGISLTYEMVDHLKTEGRCLVYEADFGYMDGHYHDLFTRRVRRAAE